MHMKADTIFSAARQANGNAFLTTKKPAKLIQAAGKEVLKPFLSKLFLFNASLEIQGVVNLSQAILAAILAAILLHVLILCSFAIVSNPFNQIKRSLAKQQENKWAAFEVDFDASPSYFSFTSSSMKTG